MQHFKDSNSGLVYAFEDNVIATADAQGIYSFKTAQVLQRFDKSTSTFVSYSVWQDVPAPTTLQPYTLPAPTAAELLANAQTMQINLISQGCELSIIAGFTSSALGAAYIYPSKPTDQLNLLGEHSASMNPNNPTTWSTKFWCADANGVWDIRVHTAAQIQQVFTDGVARKLACIEQNKSLANQVMAATTIAAAQAIVWVAP